ncbi:MAG: ribonuclease Z [Candidatus Thorarchaeota archaeon]|nr:MAG: ribonuclease Z [Candidatus Thorarchaeota archaeon]
MSRLEAVFLGTGGSMPTTGRNHPSIVIKYQGWNLMFDAGEDVQRQFERAKLGTNKRMAIYITHRHPDHLLGLGGLLLRFSLLGRTKPLSVYGPSELIEYVRMAQDSINLGTTFDTTVYAVEPGTVSEIENVRVTAFEVDHRGHALGYKVVYQKPTGPFLPERAIELDIPKGSIWRKLAAGESVVLDNGRAVNPEDVTGPQPPPLSVVYSGDTRPCDALLEASKEADLLICEAMYTSDNADLAEERGHMTAKAAAEIARDCKVKLLALTHYSPRYGDGTAIIDEARKVFPDVMLARDLMRITLSSDGTHSIEMPDAQTT